MRAERRDLVAWGLLLLAALAVTWPILLGHTLYYGDITLQFSPWRRFARQQLLAGVLPLWLPDVYCGTPFLANDQSAVLYPFHWLTLPLTPPAVLALGWLVHTALAATGGYAFGRALGRSRGAALLLGVGYALSGYLVTKQQFPSLAYTIAWLPWLFWAAARLWAEPTARRAGVAAALVGVQWLAGHAQMSVLQLALVTAWLLCRPREPGDGRRWLGWLAALGVGTGLALAQLLPTYELLRLSPRNAYGLSDAARFNLPPWQAAGWLLPRLFGSPAGRLPYLGVGPYWEMTAYVGLATLPLAVVAARRRPFWVMVGLLGLVLACGTYTPVYGLLVRVVPLVRLFRDPARFTLYPLFALLVLAAEGYDTAPLAARRAAAWLAGLLTPALVVAVLLPEGAAMALVRALLAQAPDKQVSNVRALAAAWRGDLGDQLLLALALLAATWACLGTERRGVVVVLALDLWLAGWSLNPAVPAARLAPPPSPAAHGLVYIPAGELREASLRCFGVTHYPNPGCLSATLAALPPNVNVGTGVRQVGGYDPLRATGIVAWLAALETASPAARRQTLAGLGVLGEWSRGGWTPYPEAAAEARWARTPPRTLHRPTPQRWWAESGPPGRLELTQAPLPGWRTTGALPLHADTPVSRTWAVGAGPVRAWYAPQSWRLGLFLALISLSATVVMFSSQLLHTAILPRGSQNGR